MPTYESLPSPSANFNGELYQRLVDDLRLAGKAKRTVYAYFRAVRKLAEFHEKRPDQVSEDDVALALRFRASLAAALRVGRAA